MNELKLFPSELNDLWRERIRDAKCLRRRADNPNDASEMHVPLGLGGPTLGQHPGSVGRVWEDRSNKGPAAEGSPA
jgi:hypothetical protein